MRIVITGSAADDIAESFEFYELQADGLGEYFESCIFSDIRSLIIYAGAHEIHFQFYHRKISARFPHANYYTVEKDVKTVHAVADTRRDPTRIRKRFT